MANSYSTQDLVKGALFRAGEQTDGTSPYHPLALKYINDTYVDILAGACEFDRSISECWQWARVERSITLLPAFKSGTVSFTNQSVNGTFSQIPTDSFGNNISLANYFIQVTNQDSWYQVATHVAGATAFTLLTAYIEPTASAQGFLCVPLQYSLGSQILRIAEPMRIYVDREIEYLESYEDTGRIYSLDVDQLRQKHPLKYLQNDTPTKFATISNTEAAWTVQFNKYVTTPVKVDYDVIPIPAGLIDSDQSIPVFPRAYRQVLEFTAAFHLLMDKNQTDKAGTMFKLAGEILNSMKNAETYREGQTSKTFGRLIPRATSQGRPGWLLTR